MNKTFRHGQILRLIKAKKISTQEKLAEELSALGIETTQVTLSRDMRELGLVKTPEGYKQVELAHAPAEDFASVAGEHLTDVRLAQNLMVLKTRPGHANALAVALDGASWPEVVGTVAGDDTILVVTADNPTAEALRLRLLELLK
jgi:transcriptional regulator of arginine metabolism